MNSTISATVCEHCGTDIDVNVWYPVETDLDDEGTLHFHPFCSDRCRAAWTE